MHRVEMPFDMLTGAAKVKMTMTDSREYRAFWTKFIEIYRENPCLWKVGSKDYADRTKKNQAYQVLVDKLREIDEFADRDTVVKKINSLRSSFRKEAKKVTASLNSGSGAEDVYTPSLWYYSLLLFLHDPEMPQKSISNIEEGWAEPHEELDLCEPSASSECDALTRRISGFSDGDNNYIGTPIRKKIKTVSETDAESVDSVLALMDNRQGLSRQEDEFDAIGKNVAAKLRKMPNQVRILTEKLLNDVLFQAEMGFLRADSKIVSETHLYNATIVQTNSSNDYVVDSLKVEQ